MTPALLAVPSPLSPVIFEVGPFTVRYYGLFIALGVVAAVWLASREMERRGYDGALALDALLFIVPPGFIGARIAYVLSNWESYSGDLVSTLQVWEGGLVIHGAVIGGLLGGLVFCRFRDIGPLAFADAAAPGLILGQALGRWGNYFNQELYGRPTDLPWAIRIASENRYAGFADAATFHPTFFYEFVWNLLVCLALLWVARRFASGLKTGDVFFLYVVLYSVGRFFIGMLRIDPLFIIGDAIRGYVVLSAVLALSFALILFLRHAAAPPNRKRSG